MTTLSALRANYAAMDIRLWKLLGTGQHDEFVKLWRYMAVIKDRIETAKKWACKYDK